MLEILALIVCVYTVLAAAVAVIGSVLGIVWGMVFWPLWLVYQIIRFPFRLFGI